MIVPALMFAAAVSLGDAGWFSLLARSGVTATGTMRVTGDVSKPASGIAPAVGSIRSGDDALKDAEKAWNGLASTATSPPPDSLIVDPGTTVRHVNGADSSHIFWLVDGSATIRARSTFIGTLIATSNITVEHGVTVAGRLISLQGSIALDTDDINLCCDPDDGTRHMFSLFDGSLPPGTTLNDDGTLSGTPPPGTYAFIVLAIDFKGCSRIETRTVVACPTTTVEPETLPDAVTGSAYSIPITATGMHRFTATNLPPGLALDPTCVNGTPLCGTPSAAGTYTFTITATDCDSGCSGSREYTLKVACPAITILPEALDDGTAGVEYAKVLTASGSLEPYRFEATSAPAGVIVEPSGRLSFTPATAGTYDVAVKATDSHGCSGTRSYAIHICPQITLSPASLPNAIVNTPLIAQFTGPYTFTATNLPSWLTLTPDGLLSGTPPTPGEYPFTVTATASGCSVSGDYVLHVAGTPFDCAAIVLSPSTLSRGTLLVPYDKTITVSGGTPPYTIAVNGNIPPGLTPPLHIAGVPTTLGVFAFIVTATDANGCSGSQSYTIAIEPATPPGAVVPVLTPAALLVLAIVLACAGLIAVRRMS